MRAHKRNIRRLAQPVIHSGREIFPTQGHITTTAITLGDTPFNQAGIVQDIEMMGEEIALQFSQIAELGDSPITDRELIHDLEASLIAEGRMSLGAISEIHMLELY